MLDQLRPYHLILSVLLQDKINCSISKTEIQASVKPSGIRHTPNTTSRMVRPFEMRAINIPTKGAQAIHQAQ